MVPAQVSATASYLSNWQEEGYLGTMFTGPHEPGRRRKRKMMPEDVPWALPRPRPDDENIDATGACSARFRDPDIISEQWDQTAGIDHRKRSGTVAAHGHGVHDAARQL
jgi:hypothetical protein